MATRITATPTGRRPGLQRLGTRLAPDPGATGDLKARQATAVAEVEAHPALARARGAYDTVVALARERETARTQAFQVEQQKVLSRVLPEPTDAELRGEVPSRAAALEMLARSFGDQAAAEIDAQYETQIDAALAAAQEAVAEFERAHQPPMDLLLKALNPTDAPRLMVLAQEARNGTAAQFASLCDEAIVLQDRGAYTMLMRVGAGLLDPTTGKFGGSAERDVVEGALVRLAVPFATVPVLKAQYARALLEAGDGAFSGLNVGLAGLGGLAQKADAVDQLALSIRTGTFTAFTPIAADADLGRRWEDVVRAASAPESSVWVLHGNRLVPGGESSGEARGPVQRFHDTGVSAI